MDRNAGKEVRGYIRKICLKREIGHGIRKERVDRPAHELSEDARWVTAFRVTSCKCGMLPQLAVEHAAG